MNIYDISKRAGVSIATVSRVLNYSEKVSEATRQKVLSVMEETGYMPNAFARSLGLNSMFTVGIMCADSSDIHLAKAIFYLERELRNNHYASMLCCTGYELEDRKKYLQLLLGRNVDAILFVGSNFIEDTPEQNAYLFDTAKKMPVFLLNGHLPGDNIYSVLCDDYEATRILTEEMIKSGSRNPFYLYRSLSYSGRRKLSGFQDACKKYEIPHTGERCCQSPSSLEETVFFVKELLEEDPSIDAFITSDDELAAGAVKCAHTSKILLPEELQIAGYNNSLLSLCSTPEITTVDSRLEFLCITAVSLLMQTLQGKEAPQKTIFSGSIVRRGTTRF